MSASEKAVQLRSLVRMLTDASEVMIKEWEAQEESLAAISDASLPSPEMYEARRVITGAYGMVTDLVQEPASRLSEITCSFFTARALHIAVEARVADVIAEANPAEGMSAVAIGKRVGIDAQKLTRVMRTLCTVHIFTEVKDGYFANNRTSQCLVGDQYLRCWLLLHAMEMYTASDKLKSLLFDPAKTYSTSNRVSAWQEAIDDHFTVWEYLEQQIQQPDGSIKPNPSLEIWALGMVGGGHAFANGMYADYPWEALGSSTIVDVGGGAGGTSLDLAKKFPNLKFVVEDRASTIKQAESIWMREYPEALQTGRVRLLTHNFFAEQPIKRADVYFMRYILHDWPDDNCVTILTHIRKAMGPNSIILIADQIIHTTVGSPRLKAAPPPLPPNYGYASQFGNHHDLTMMACHNGMERTPEMLDALAARAGLRVAKIWECRGLIAIAELKRDDGA
ncbi:S-adenosyl-L-methionine-dependent methyltransferase [Laetiporus sulphureus 93-53]|uniref:S-adenosyl-L-methionine-dependent methyltransferase n=1 Tax=Laetiporus sulphureus 93-53 TaxID=1314785 RepID=A0A165I3U6_9APHY|nr:S-adenosyl-L-methionine-dependent methyltransferase [Laetiporus sulphureus 93-53]KZT12560.1 S-adenosyl-L-methionine-dependent methyltransferase [Laetiporus sulphureus 93-53]